jgi:glycosyltransferase involved in cell wall biosynthesis
MTPLVQGAGMYLFDTRWIGPHGIGRFASELYRRLEFFSPGNLHGRPSSAMEALRLTRHLRRAPQNSLFFTPGYNCPIGRPCRFMFCLHDLNHLHVPENSNPLKRLYYASVVRPAIHNSEAVITVSRFTQSLICEWAGVDESRVFNIGNGVSDGFGPDGPVKTFGARPYILHVGSSKPHKNLPRTMQAFAESKLWKDFDFVTTARPKPELVALANNISLAGYVRFLGEISEDDLAALYRGAHMLIFVSLYEGFGLPIVEAMACGTPVLTSSVASMPEIAGDAALAVDPYDVEAIKEALLRLAYDTDLRQALRIRGAERAKAYSWDSAAQRLRSVLTACGSLGMPRVDCA